jgi:hypothetical protein
MNKPKPFFKNFDYADDPTGPGTGLYAKPGKYKSVEDFRLQYQKRKKKRRLAMLSLILQATDKNFIVDPQEGIFNVPFNPSEIAPFGLLDGLYPQEDLENKPSGNLFYGVQDSHLFYSDDGKTEETSEDSEETHNLASDPKD